MAPLFRMAGLMVGPPAAGTHPLRSTWDVVTTSGAAEELERMAQVLRTGRGRIRFDDEVSAVQFHRAIFFRVRIATGHGARAFASISLGARLSRSRSGSGPGRMHDHNRGTPHNRGGRLMGKEKQEFEFAAITDTKDAAGYLEAIAKGLREGRINIAAGDQQIELVPAGDIDVEILAKRKDDKSKLELEISWKKGVGAGIGELVVSTPAAAKTVKTV